MFFDIQVKEFDILIDQKKLLKEFILPQRCSHCGYSEFRKSDMLSPLIVHFIDGDIHNKKPNNLRLFCYNCYFILSVIKHRPTDSKIPRTFEEAQDEITGDTLVYTPKEINLAMSKKGGLDNKIRKVSFFFL